MRADDGALRANVSFAKVGVIEDTPKTSWLCRRISSRWATNSKRSYPAARSRL